MNGSYLREITFAHGIILHVLSNKEVKFTWSWLQCTVQLYTAFREEYVAEHNNIHSTISKAWAIFGVWMALLLYLLCNCHQLSVMPSQSNLGDLLKLGFIGLRLATFYATSHWSHKNHVSSSSRKPGWSWVGQAGGPHHGLGQGQTVSSSPTKHRKGLHLCGCVTLTNETTKHEPRNPVWSQRHGAEVESHNASNHFSPLIDRYPRYSIDLVYLTYQCHNGVIC